MLRALPLIALLCAPALAEVPGEGLLRKGEARALEKSLGLSDLEDLPHYDLDLSLSDATGQYAGNSVVRWTNRSGAARSSWEFQLESNGAERGGGTLSVGEVDVVEGPAATWKMTGDTRGTLTFGRPIAPGETVAVRMQFAGELRELPPGSNDVFGQVPQMGGEDFGLLARGDGLVTVALAYPALAPVGSEASTGTGDRSWNEVARFETRVVLPDGLVAVTNLVDGASKPLSQGVSVMESAGVGVREFVLVASRKLEVAETQVGDVTVRSWFLDQDREAGMTALDDAAASLRFLERYGDYPFTELDIVEASLVGGAGGMEFSSLALVGAFLYRDPVASNDPLAAQLELLGQLGGGGSALQKMGDTIADSRRFVIAHEVAHQWSPGLVGADSVRHPYIDEPLAQYLAARAVSDMQLTVTPEALLERNGLLSYAMMRALGGADGPVERSTTDFGHHAVYAGLVYGKAPYLYQRAEAELGREVVDAAIANAVETHRWQVATPDGWIAALKKGGIKDANTRRQRWWQQSHGDADLGVDERGSKALALILGDPNLAAQLEPTLALMGMTPAQFIRQFMGSVMGGVITDSGTLGTQPTPEEMLELLEREQP